MKILSYFLVVFFVSLPAVVLGQSSVYQQCGSSVQNICWQKLTGEFFGDERLMSFDGTSWYYAYFFRNKKNFSTGRDEANGARTSISVSHDGLVGRNLQAGEFFPFNKNYNNVLPEIREAFLAASDPRRKTIQRNLKRLHLYNSTIDGLWGRNTFNAIIGYNVVFKKSLQVGSYSKGNVLLDAIRQHSRFDYTNGKLNSQSGSSVKKACLSYTATSCTRLQLCTRGTTGTPKRWASNYPGKSYADQARSRGFTCGVKEQIASDATVNRGCLPSTATSCTRLQLCTRGTTGTPKRWASNYPGKSYADQARSRGFTCGVKEQIASAPLIKNCSNDPAKCGALELCQKATYSQSDSVFWRTDANGKPFAKAAQSIGLTCNVDSANPIKTYRVANGTGFFVSTNGDVVTNQHVIEGCNEVQIHAGGEMAAATIISEDKINDLAFLRTKLKAQSVFSLAPKNPYLLQDVIAVGFPFGESVSSTIKVTKGIVSALSGLGNNSGQIQIDAALQPGNSGGPIIDKNGNVVGVAVAKLDLEHSIENFGVVPENVNFGIKLSNLTTFLDDNNVNYSVGKEREMKNSSLGELATEATVLISCWMTKAGIQKMQSQKVMFKSLQD